MKKAIKRIAMLFVVCGLAVSANAGDRLFSGEDLEKYENLKKEWEALKESAKDTKTFGECHTYPYPADEDDLRLYKCGEYGQARETMELLEYADTRCGEIGCYKAREETTKKFKTLGFFNSTMSRNILKATENKMLFIEAKLMKIDALRGYNEFKAKMAKCKLSGDKECVEE